MTKHLQISSPAGAEAVELRCDGRLLMRYVFVSDAKADESPRPYAHPLCTLAGVELTNFRPNDHPWHHALSFTINNVSGVNFWGGGTYRRGEGYKMRGDHGTQRHISWSECSAARLAHALEWRSGAGELLLVEERTLSPTLDGEKAWSLRWQSRLTNVSGRTLSLGNYHSHEGLVGSHYTGLQFRGARDLLDDHGDETVGIWAEGGLSGESAVHGAAARWMEWRGQKDTTLRRVAVRFSNPGAPLHWFVRRHNPLAAFPFHYDRDVELQPAGTLEIDHLLSFADV